MDIEVIRVIGGAYRQLTDLIPDKLPNGHVQQAAQRPLIWLTRAQHAAGEAFKIPPSLNATIRSLGMLLPTSAVTETLYEEQQAAFMLGYNSKGGDNTDEIKGVRAWRQKRGMTQHQLAVASKVSRPTIGYIETGVHKPSTDTLRKLAKPLGCSIDDLVE